jgi:hypothetical protein
MIEAHVYIFFSDYMQHLSFFLHIVMSKTWVLYRNVMVNNLMTKHCVVWDLRLWQPICINIHIPLEVQHHENRICSAKNRLGIASLKTWCPSRNISTIWFPARKTHMTYSTIAVIFLYVHASLLPCLRMFESKELSGRCLAWLTCGSWEWLGDQSIDINVYKFYGSCMQVSFMQVICNYIYMNIVNMSTEVNWQM